MRIGHAREPSQKKSAILTDVEYNAEMSGKSRPIVLSAQFFTNLDANIDKDKGFAAGIRLGNTKSKGDFKLYYNFQLVEQDSVFSALKFYDCHKTSNSQKKNLHKAGRIVALDIFPQSVQFPSLTDC